jgi:hypothetical protein
MVASSSMTLNAANNRLSKLPPTRLFRLRWATRLYQPVQYPRRQRFPLPVGMRDGVSLCLNAIVLTISWSAGTSNPFGIYSLSVLKQLSLLIEPRHSQ